MEHIWLNASVKRFTVFSFVVMPDHLHLLIQTLGTNVSECMRSFKTNTSREINRYLSRTAGVDTRGTNKFQWHARFYDHIIRNAKDFATHLEYIRNNPVRAGLVEHPEGYPYLYIAPDEVFRDLF